MDITYDNGVGLTPFSIYSPASIKVEFIDPDYHATIKTTNHELVGLITDLDGETENFIIESRNKKTKIFGRFIIKERIVESNKLCGFQIEIIFV